MSATFLIARNPDPGSRLPLLVRLPLPEGPVALATREAWPATRDLYCHELDVWPRDAEVVEEIPCVACWRHGASVHLVLSRRTRRRSIFVWTKSKGKGPEELASNAVSGALAIAPDADGAGDGGRDDGSQ